MSTNEIRIDREALTAIVAHARRDAPNECCGLLVGHPAALPEHGTAGPAPDSALGASSGKEAGPHVLEAIPCSNGSSEPAKRYEISPVDYFAQIKRCRRINEAQSENFAVVGAYHSHPRGGPEASETDTAQAFRDFVFVIVGVGGEARGMKIRAYTFDDERLTPGALTVVD